MTHDETMKMTQKAIDVAKEAVTTFRDRPKQLKCGPIKWVSSETSLQEANHQRILHLEKTVEELLVKIDKLARKEYVVHCDFSSDDYKPGSITWTEHAIYGGFQS